MAEMKKGQGIKNPLAQSLVEFALVLSLLLLLIMGAMDFGRMFYAKMVLRNAAREGANYLAFHQSDKDYGYVDTFAAIEAEVNNSFVEVGAEDVEYLDCCTPGDKAGVKITNTIDLIFDGFLQSFGLLGGPVELTSTVWMVVQ